jgi:hypothetical protein
LFLLSYFSFICIQLGNDLSIHSKKFNQDSEKKTFLEIKSQND